MTTPGATEAVTPEQRARDVISRNPYGCIACGASLPNEDCGHRKNGVPNACMPAADNLEADLAQTIREAEANALRRAAELVDKFNHDMSAGIPIRHQIASAIRSLLPKEEGKA